MEEILLALVGAYVLGNVGSRSRDRLRNRKVRRIAAELRAHPSGVDLREHHALMLAKRKVRHRRTPSPFRPVLRAKRKTRGWHLKPKEVRVERVGEEERRVGVDHANWIRLYPNPGYRIAGVHWCRATHPHRVRWED